MKNVLSIQPHVVFGHAGNSATVFPIQRLGVNVWPLHTMQVSNHMQYGRWAGSAIEASQILALVEGIGAIGMLRRCDAVLCGYLDSVAHLQAVVDIVRAVKATNPYAWFFCDPIINEHLTERNHEAALATIPEGADCVTPHHDALQKLAGRTLDTVDEAVLACRELIRRGPRIILVKQLLDRYSPADRVNLLVVTESEAWMAQHPRYPFARPPAGISELTNAVFVARRLRGDTLRAAFEHTVAAVHAVLKATYEAGRYELEITAAQNDIAHPREWLGAWFVDAR